MKVPGVLLMLGTLRGNSFLSNNLHYKRLSTTQIDWLATKPHEPVLEFKVLIGCGHLSFCRTVWLLIRKSKMAANR